MVTQLQPDVRAYLHGGEVIKRYIRVEEVAHEYGFSVEETEYIAKPIIVESEPDWYVKQVMEDFVVRAERIRGGGVDPSVDNFLKITHEARLLGTDARLIDKDAPNNPDGKLNKVAENVWKEYEKGNANGHIGCQLIFSDIGTPGPDKDFTIYDYLKETLIQYGIPAEEIAFIHDAKTDAQRDALFKEMRTGKKGIVRSTGAT